MPLLADNLKSLYASLVVSALIITGLVLGREIFIPLAISACLAFVLSPIVGWLSRRGVPAGLAASGIVAFALTAFLLVGTLIVSQMVTLAGDLGRYRATLIEKARSVTHSAKSDGAIRRAADAIGTIGKDLKKEIAGSDGPPRDPAVPSGTAKSAETPTVVVAVPGNDVGIADILGSVTHKLAQVGLTLLFTLFMLLQSSDLRDRILRIAGTDNLSGTTAALSDAGERLSSLFLTQALMNVAFGTVVGIALWLIGVPYSMLWGGLTILMRFIPFVGALIAAIPPVLLAAAVDPGWTMAMLVLAVFVVGEPIMGHLIEPLVLGAKAGLSPFAMVVSASFWALLWGPIGLILAAPLTMVLVVLGRYVRGLEIATVLLGDEPALTTHERLYHRLLSGDTLGASQQLETALADQSLVQVVDTIVLPALAAASDDLARGLVERAQTEEVRDGLMEISRLIGDRSSSASGDEIVTRRSGQPRVVVLPARSQIDIAAADMIARTLETDLPVSAAGVLQSTGLTAISQISIAGDRTPDSIVIVATSAEDAQYLPLIARRAQKAFPGAGIRMLAAGSDRDGRLQGIASRAGVPLFSRLGEIVEQLAHLEAMAPSRAA